VPSGFAVLDTSAYKTLASPAALARFRANLRLADVQPIASEVNLLEAASASPAGVQKRLLATIKEVAGKAGLIPWPFQILQQVGRAVIDGESGFYVRESGKEWYLDDLQAIDEVRGRATEMRERMEAQFSRLHDNARRDLQRKIKASGYRFTADGFREFLDGEWAKGELRRIFAAATWKALRLPGEAPVDTLLLNEGWRLLLDAEGFAIYQRALVHTQPKRVHRTDLIQLVYLAGVPKRILVTADRPFLDAANAILAGRYPNARAVHISEMVT
jgi:hypothetical protein